jgi:hypothetical protein
MRVHTTITVGVVTDEHRPTPPNGGAPAEFNQRLDAAIMEIEGAGRRAEVQFSHSVAIDRSYKRTMTYSALVLSHPLG